MEDLVRLREELETLRARVRVLAWGGAVALVALVAVVLAGRGEPEAPGVLAVQELLLEDAEGQVRGRWHVTARGEARLELADAEGRPRITQQVGSAHTALELTDGKGETLARLSALGDLTGLQLSRAGSAQSVQLQVSEGDASLHLLDLDHTLSASLRANVEGTDLLLGRSPEGLPAQAAALSAGGRAARPPAFFLLRGDDFVEASIEVAPRLLLGGEDEIGSRSGVEGPVWERRARTASPPAASSPLPGDD